jgi:hypothetical protein
MGIIAKRSLIREMRRLNEKSYLQERPKMLSRLRLQWVSPHYFPQFHCTSISQVSSYIFRPVRNRLK